MSAIVSNVRGSVGCRELLLRVLAFRASQFALNSALAVTRSLHEPIGKSARQVDGDVPNPDAWRALAGGPDTTDGLAEPSSVQVSLSRVRI